MVSILIKLFLLRFPSKSFFSSSFSNSFNDSFEVIGQVRQYLCFLLNSLFEIEMISKNSNLNYTFLLNYLKTKLIYYSTYDASIIV